MTEIFCKLENSAHWDEHPCCGCVHQNSIKCPHSLEGKIFKVMREWHGITGKEEKHDIAEKISIDLLDKFTDAYSEPFRNCRQRNKNGQKRK